MKKDKAKTIEFEKASAKRFADPGLADAVADALYSRTQIGFGVYTILKAKRLKQREMAELLGIPQPEVSHLMNGHFSRSTTDKLLDFLRRLDRKVTIESSPREAGEPNQQTGFGS